MGLGNEILFKRSTSHATMPIYVKILKIFSGTKWLMTLKIGLQHLVHEYYQVCSNDDPELTITYFEGMSNSVPYAFVWEKGKTVVVYDVKAGIRC